MQCRLTQAKARLLPSRLKNYSLLLLGLLLMQSAHAEIIWFDIKDPNIKDALFDSYQHRHFNAITKLQVAQKLGRVHSQDNAGLVLGGLYLAYGL